MSVCLLTSAVAEVRLDTQQEAVASFPGYVERTAAYGFHVLSETVGLVVSDISLDGAPVSVDITRVRIGVDDRRLTQRGWSSPW